MARGGRNDEKHATLSTRRLEAFSDGVFAIAATLLVLDLSVNHLGETFTTNDDLFEALLSQQSLNTFTSFVISFALLAFFWGVHVRQFEWIVAINGRVILLNNARLFFIVLIPFTTSLNSTYAEFEVARMLMPINFALVSLTSALMWDYVCRSKLGLIERISRQRIAATSGHGWSAFGIGVGVVILSPFVGPWAFALYTVDFLFATLIERWATKKYPGDPSSADEPVEGRAGDDD